ncbi:MAG: hypothetical protein Q8K72_14560, partial [Acidimicrobiales bacterium]|nr:hypothetical protein [Acidimicrobiales bacterium]
PLVLGPDGERLAKRHGAVSLAELAGAGIGPEEVLRRLAASAGLVAVGEQVGSPAELLERFAPDRLLADIVAEV